MTPDTTRLLIVDDRAPVRKRIIQLLAPVSWIDVVGEAGGSENALYQASHLKPDVILMDFMMTEGSGIWTLRYIKKVLPKIRIIVVTSAEDKKSVIKAILAGADGYLLKDCDDQSLVQAIRDVTQGGLPIHPRLVPYLVKYSKSRTYNFTNFDLSEREKEVLTLVAEGMTNLEIAQVLELSEYTIKGHISNILSKMDAGNRMKAVKLAIKEGLIFP